MEQEQQNSSAENNEHPVTGDDDDDVVEENLTLSLLTDFMNKLNDTKLVLTENDPNF
jgi:hypothetical protein